MSFMGFLAWGSDGARAGRDADGSFRAAGGSGGRFRALAGRDYGRGGAGATERGDDGEQSPGMLRRLPGDGHVELRDIGPRGLTAVRRVHVNLQLTGGVIGLQSVAYGQAGAIGDDGQS